MAISHTELNAGHLRGCDDGRKGAAGLRPPAWLTGSDNYCLVSGARCGKVLRGAQSLAD